VQGKCSLDLSVIYLLAVTFYLLHVGVIRLFLYLHLVSYRFYTILPIPSGQILGIISILYLLVSPITTKSQALPVSRPGAPIDPSIQKARIIIHSIIQIYSY